MLRVPVEVVLRNVDDAPAEPPRATEEGDTIVGPGPKEVLVKNDWKMGRTTARDLRPPG